MIKFTAGKYEVEYKNGRTWDVWLSVSQRKAFNQDLMEDLEIRSLRLKGEGMGNRSRIGISCLVWVIMLVLGVSQGYCQDYSNEQIANAIYKAENSKGHPYGILKHYKTTTPRQACLNTIEHAKRDWDGKGDFIIFLGSRYCPVGAENDPTNLNKNWVGNVKHFLEKEEAKARPKALVE